MAPVVPSITTLGLALSLVPTAIVIAIMLCWHADARGALYASARMLLQLLVIGYVLIYIFESDDARTIVAVLGVMMAIASWIAIRTLAHRNKRAYLAALIGISLGSLPTLVLITQTILLVEPWFSPRYVVPLAGMLFAGAMNAVSLAAERYEAEISRALAPVEARKIAFQSSMIPAVNALLAVGLVSLPGMMTGQILSGVSPLVAAKYQIVVMSMLFGASGIAAAIFLSLHRPTPPSSSR